VCASTISACVGAWNCATALPQDEQHAKSAQQTDLRAIHKQITTLYEQGKFKEVEPLMRRYVQGIESSSAAPGALSQTYSSYAALLQKLHKPAESQQFSLKAQQAKELETKSKAKAALHHALKNSSDRLVAATDSTTGVIGIKFVIKNDDPPTIAEVYPDTPAYKAGLHVGDQIVSVNGQVTDSMSKEDLYDLIIGPPGTDVQVTVKRGSNSPITAKMTRMSSELFPDTLRDTYRKSR
jgi:C-terminal processing protease CtpA/Prc